MPTSKKTVTIELNSEFIKELNEILKYLKIASPEELIKNYLREVVIAARVQQATAQTSKSVIDRSKDLDFLLKASK